MAYILGNKYPIIIKCHMHQVTIAQKMSNYKIHNKKYWLADLVGWSISWLNGKLPVGSVG